MVIPTVFLPDSENPIPDATADDVNESAAKVAPADAVIVGLVVRIVFLKNIVA